MKILVKKVNDKSVDAYEKGMDILKNNDGASMTEYLIVVIIVVVAGGILFTTFPTTMEEIFNSVFDTMKSTFGL